MAKNLLDKALDKKKKEKNLVCQRCKKEIKEPSYVLVGGSVITNVNSPMVFSCPEHAFNYNQRIVLHDTCWIEMLGEYGSPLYDMEKVRKKYNELAKKQKKKK